MTAAQLRVPAAGAPGLQHLPGWGSVSGVGCPWGEVEDKQQMFVLNMTSSSEKYISKH